MNFLQKIISKSILKSLETLSKNDPKIRSQWEELGKASEELAKSVNDYQKKHPNRPLPTYADKFIKK